MATNISKKTGRREVGGQPPLPCTPLRIRTGDEIHLPLRVAAGLRLGRYYTMSGAKTLSHVLVTISATYSWRIVLYAWLPFGQSPNPQPAMQNQLSF